MRLLLFINRFQNIQTLEKMQKLLNTINNLSDEDRNPKEQYFILSFNFNIIFKCFNLLKHQTLLNYIEIIGVPMYNNENCVDVILNIAFILDIPLLIKFFMKV